ncbi:hypothetical protein DY000_02032542 [Brassica cretica]|uniref:Uncharacterized protein n=1 Tax=Brassica cretica TaxID=69181 RepID=A0ABQ7DK59_BRACR|nr:hypothetical protein DY000_02032542 [Brassica cretica]
MRPWKIRLKAEDQGKLRRDGDPAAAGKLRSTHSTECSTSSDTLVAKSAAKDLRHPSPSLTYFDSDLRENCEEPTPLWEAHSGQVRIIRSKNASAANALTPSCHLFPSNKHGYSLENAQSSLAAPSWCSFFQL